MGQVIELSPRARPRTPVRLAQPVALVQANASVATSVAVNISADGLRVFCDREASHALCLEDDRFSGEDAPTIDAHFMLPIEGGLVKVDAHCRVAYVVRVNTQTLAMGLEFLALDDLARHYVETFLGKSDAPA